MIKLKNGYEVDFTKDFDLFFKNLLTAIIRESKSAVEKTNKENEVEDDLNDKFLQELMDNCIYVTHQLFELSKTNEDLSKFMVTGFIFNSIILALPAAEKITGKSSDEEIIH